MEIPVFALTAWAKIVYVPVPMSCVAQLTRTVPSLFSATATSHGMRKAPHEAHAIPQPRTSSPWRIEPTAGLRFDHPNFSAPVVIHSLRWREENGLPLLSSFSGSLHRRSST